MIITLNNEKKTVKDGSTLMELLLSEKIIADAGNLAGIAAAVNESIVSKKAGLSTCSGKVTRLMYSAWYREADNAG